MDVKKFVAENMQEAISDIKKEMGSDALIISTRKIREGKGVFGLFGKEKLEVTATSPKYDDVQDMDETSMNTVASARYQRNLPNRYPPYNEENHAGSESENMAAIKNIQDNVVEPLKLEIDEVKTALEDIFAHVKEEKNADNHVFHLRHDVNELKGLISAYLNKEHLIPFKNLHKNLAAVYQQLLINGIEEKFSRRLIEEARFKISPQNFENYNYVKLYMARMIMQLIRATDVFDESSGNNRFFSFVGPTGVGKTASLAKCAGLIKENVPDSNIAIITLDASRTGSTEQLKNFSKSIRAKFRIAETAVDLKKYYHEFKANHYILIDTAGMSQRDGDKINALREKIEGIEQIRHLLVLSATTKDSDITEQTKRFGMLKIAGVVFSKLDESASYGNILNQLIRFKFPLYFLTMGQNVPDDIEIASKERIVDLIMNFTRDEE